MYSKIDPHALVSPISRAPTLTYASRNPLAQDTCVHSLNAQPCCHNFLPQLCRLAHLHTPTNAPMYIHREWACRYTVSSTGWVRTPFSVRECVCVCGCAYVYGLVCMGAPCCVVAHTGGYPWRLCMLSWKECGVTAWFFLLRCTVPQETRVHNHITPSCGKRRLRWAKPIGSRAGGKNLGGGQDNRRKLPERQRNRI